MKYMLLIYSAEVAWTEQELGDCLGKSLAICEELRAQGKLISASPLHPVASATSIRIRGGNRQITDGPFAETTEQLGGFYLLELDNLDEAIAVASRLPPVHKGTIEIRPLSPLPEPLAEAGDGRGDEQVFLRDLRIGASPATVYRALTTQQGIEGWWTATCSVSRETGGDVTVRFDRTFKTFHIDRLVPSTLVRWRCIDARLEIPGHSLRPDEWVGTVIQFSLRGDAAGGGTVLSLAHIGLLPRFDCYEICCAGWVQFLESLKQYCETGVGAPFGGSKVCGQSKGR